MIFINIYQIKQTSRSKPVEAMHLDNVYFAFFRFSTSKWNQAIKNDFKTIKPTQKNKIEFVVLLSDAYAII